MIYQDGSAQLDALPPPKAPRAEVIDELYQAVVNGKAPIHNGAWATATVEVLLAMLRSAREGSEVRLDHQVALP
jgi:phthalate 4,5-cis-dihydrodiol dehydrogenase